MCQISNANRPSSTASSASGRSTLNNDYHSTDSLPEPQPQPTKVEPKPQAVRPQHASEPGPFHHDFFDPAISKERTAFLRAILTGMAITAVAVLGILSIYWGSVWKSSAYTQGLHGIVVDFDEGPLGQAVITAFTGLKGQARQITWTIVDPSHYSDAQAVANDIVTQKHWVAVVGECCFPFCVDFSIAYVFDITFLKFMVTPHSQPQFTRVQVLISHELFKLRTKVTMVTWQ